MKVFGSYDIRIDGSELSTKADVEDYESSVNLILHGYQQSTSGSAVLDAIKLTKTRIRILPYTKEIEKSSGKCNAITYPEYILDAIQKGNPVFGKNGKMLTEQIPIKSLLNLPQELLVGTGKGSESTIRFSPKMWGYGSLCSPGKPGSRPSEVLLHELVHGYRNARGHRSLAPLVGSIQRYDNLEDFIAILVTNIYISDPKNPRAGRTLMADHRGFEPLPDALSTSKGFLSRKPNEKLIGMFVADEPGLALDLKEVGGAFNPIREYIVPGSSPSDVDKTVEVVRGSTLSGIAESEYGSWELWPLVYDLNKIKIGPNPNRVPTGESILVAPLSRYTTEQIADAKRRAPSWKQYR